MLGSKIPVRKSRTFILLQIRVIKRVMTWILNPEIRSKTRTISIDYDRIVR